jgi:hypothetical protein
VHVSSEMGGCRSTTSTVPMSFRSWYFLKSFYCSCHASSMLTDPNCVALHASHTTKFSYLSFFSVLFRATFCRWSWNINKKAEFIYFSFLLLYIVYLLIIIYLYYCHCHFI